MFEKKTIDYYKNHKLRSRTHTDLGRAYTVKSMSYGVGGKLERYERVYIRLIEEDGRVPKFEAKPEDRNLWGKINPRFIVFLDGSLTDKEGWDVMNSIIKKSRTKK